jgi:DNA-binding CsgD family transcriptional regulator
MDKIRKNIAVVEPSKIIYEGLCTSILRLGYDYSFYYFDSLNEMELFNYKKEISIVLINPGLVQNRVNEFVKIKNQNPEILWIGIVYSFYDYSILKLFDDSFTILDDISVIIRKINKLSNINKANSPEDMQLSEREIQVLQFIANGLSSKEIAKKLNISIHTVNSHRKNIMEKTGIRSLAGLTIYAVSKGIISID